MGGAASRIAAQHGASWAAGDGGGAATAGLAVRGEGERRNGLTAPISSSDAGTAAQAAAAAAASSRIDPPLPPDGVAVAPLPIADERVSRPAGPGGVMDAPKSSLSPLATRGGVPPDWARAPSSGGSDGGSGGGGGGGGCSKVMADRAAAKSADRGR